MGFGKRLKQIRQQLGLTGPQLAAQLGVQRTSIPQYESGRSFPSVSVLMKLSRILGVSVDWLLFDDYDIPNQLRDKELLEYFSKLDRLGRRERSQVKDFIDGVLARDELENLKRGESKGHKAA